MLVEGGPGLVPMKLLIWDHVVKFDALEGRVLFDPLFNSSVADGMHQVEMTRHLFLQELDVQVGRVVLCMVLSWRVLYDAAGNFSGVVKVDGVLVNQDTEELGRQQHHQERVRFLNLDLLLKD